MKHIFNTCSEVAVVEARERAQESLLQLGFVPVDHMFNTLVRFVGVPALLRPKVCKITAVYLCDCDLVDYFDWRER